MPSAWDFWAFLGTWFPAAVASVNILLGTVQSVPWVLLLPIAAMTFGGLSVGLFYFSEWQQKRSVVSKLNFAHPRVSAYPDTNTLCLGFQLQSNADFPIQCEVVAIAAKIGDRVPLQQEDLPALFEVPPHGYMFYDSHQIEFKPDEPLIAEGSIKFEVRYGRNDNRTETITGSKIIHLQFDADGKVTGQPAWVDTPGRTRH